jgi:putative heme-binding domain-containing protein
MPRYSPALFIAIALLVMGSQSSCPGTHGAETQDGKHFTQKPEVAPAAGQTPSAAATPAEAPFPVKNWVAEGPQPQWIWGADQNRKYFVRKTFPGGTKAARLRTSCDNVVTIRINGKQVLHSSEWQTPAEADVQKFVQTGENLLEAEIANEGGVAAFILKMALVTADGKTEYLVTDESWQVAASGDAKEWVRPRIVGKHGDAPWGAVLSGAAAAGVIRDTFNLLPGFQVERLFTVPKETLGSWVCLAVDGKGRLLASDQEGRGICRITPPPIGTSDETKVELLDLAIDGKRVSGAQGMLWAFDSLYVCCNGGPGSGLYRARDKDGDGQFEEVVKLRDLRGGGEHGPHALRLAPDGKSIYVDCGNHTLPPFDRKLSAPPQTMGGVRAEQLRAELPPGMASRIAPNWDEDLLLPRQWDANGHAAGILAPGGWIAKTDADGKTWEIFSIGYRNQYDFAFNGDGEMFVYDADMEWDMGSPWYRPTRVVHATSGSEFGWRSGTGKWPPYYVDSLPQLVDIGPGSPVGVEFGYGTKFPAKYQKALFICDWTFATMYAIHMEPSGASYRAVKEEFLSRTPLPLTDVVVGADGALYFSIGGRGTQSELFRVTYVGPESTSPADPHDAKDADLRALRREIETYHRADHSPADAAAHDSGVHEKAAAFLVPHLAHADRHIRYAARIALERLPLAAWQEQVLAAQEPETVITGVVGLARLADPALRPRLLAALGRLEFASLAAHQQLEWLRAYQLVFIRLGLPPDDERLALGSRFDVLFPTGSNPHDQELAILMVALGSPQAAAKIVPMLTRPRVASQEVSEALLARNRGYGGSIAAMLANQPDLAQYGFAFTLRNLKTGWTIDQRKTYFAWFNQARQWSGGNSYQKFLTNIDNDAFANATDAERLAVEAFGIRKPYVAPELPKPRGPGRAYTAAEVVSLADKLAGRNFRNGLRMFAAARCVVCHRYGGDGGATGPDLTQLAGRFNLKDLVDSIVEPSKVISDQYRAMVVRTDDGQVHTGRIISESSDAITLVVDPENATKVQVIPKARIEASTPSSVSLMPKDLLNGLNENEVLDLLAYLLSRGNPRDAMFRP